MNGKNHVSRDLIAHEYASMGDECWIGPHVELGPYVMLAPRVAIVGGDHRYDIPDKPTMFSGRPKVKKTVIEADAWIGYGAIIMAGTRVGRGAIIGAGSLVLKKNIAPYEVYWGVPARKIFDRFPNPEDRERHDKMLAEKPKEGEWAAPFWD
jgi:acetyltransferase-like isoleucine patch superfamily enzyme